VLSFFTSNIDTADKLDILVCFLTVRSLGMICYMLSARNSDVVKKRRIDYTSLFDVDPIDTLACSQGAWLV
jgi:hypothetical protein